MSVFNNSITDVDYRVANFLTNQDKIVFSGVNRTTYQLFSNNFYFKLVFQSDHPGLVKSAVFKDKHCVIQYLCDRHPTNCWKVLSCMFQTGIFTFSRSFLNAAIPFEIEKLKKEQVILEAQLDETTPLLQEAELAHNQTKYLLESDNAVDEALRIMVFADREAEFKNHMANAVDRTKENWMEAALAIALDFDGRLLPVANLKKYQLLKDQEQGIKYNLDAVKRSLSTLENSDMSTFVFQNEKIKINDLYFTNLRKYMFEISRKTEKLTPVDLEEFSSKIICYSNANDTVALSLDDTFSADNLLTSVINIKYYISTKSPSEKESQNSSILDSNCNEILLLIDEKIENKKYNNQLETCIGFLAASNFSITSFETQTNSLHDQFPEISLEKINDDLRRLAQARYGDAALKQLGDKN